jgi:hypothetical protein
MGGYATVYYPSSMQQSTAEIIMLRAGEERAGLDITLPLIRTYRVDGTVIDADGNPPRDRPSIYLVDVSGNTSAFSGVKEAFGSKFSFEGVAPGAYTVAAGVEETKRWAIADLSVGGQNASVTLTLQPGLSVSGRVVFDGSLAPPTDLTRIRISLTPANNVGLSMMPTPASPSAGGAFGITGVLPGSYRVMASLPGANSTATAGAGWTLRSATIGGQDVADVPVEMRAGMDLDNVVVTFTDRPTELSGRLEDASGRPAVEYFIILFSTDQRTWFTRSRRIVQTRPGSDGQFVVRGLPPGDYLLAALTDVQPGEWYDAAFLRSLVPAAMRVSLGAGEKKVQNLAIR